jgi:AcrR family transcriptional regulator
MSERRRARTLSKASSPNKRSKVKRAGRDADAARADIIAVATEEFSRKGLSGSRVDEIAERTHTVKRMIYYYFGSKEGLYLAVLKRAYEAIRSLEASLDLDSYAPTEALRALVGATFDYHNQNPDFVRLVMNENIHHGEHIGQLAIIKARKASVLGLLRRLINRGINSGVFRKDVDPVDVHMTISALCFYNVSNRHTFSRIFERDMTSPRATKRRRQIVLDIVERWCRA